METKKEVFIITIDENENIIEKKCTVFLDDNGTEIARSPTYTQTVTPGDPMQRINICGNKTKAIVNLIHTPEVVAAYKIKMRKINEPAKNQ